MNECIRCHLDGREDNAGKTPVGAFIKPMEQDILKALALLVYGVTFDPYPNDPSNCKYSKYFAVKYRFSIYSMYDSKHKHKPQTN